MILKCRNFDAFYFAFSQCSNEAFDEQTEFLRVFNFMILNLLVKIWCTQKCVLQYSASVWCTDKAHD